MNKIDYINPENMAKPKGYSHAISVSGNHKTVYIGGQDAVAVVYEKDEQE